MKTVYRRCSRKFGLLESEWFLWRPRVAQNDKMNGRPSPYAPSPLPRIQGILPPSSLAMRSVAGPYSLSAAPPPPSNVPLKRDEQTKSRPPYAQRQA
jgi:hypothetical protein